ncbi:hypothetical protein BKA57DRAFT_170086 [Linnemannia elongata]|nr:hypothetical protein BKA57DRAFT_170086 [Linnemannia elongata]
MGLKMPRNKKGKLLLRASGWHKNPWRSRCYCSFLSVNALFFTVNQKTIPRRDTFTRQTPLLFLPFPSSSHRLCPLNQFLVCLAFTVLICINMHLSPLPYFSSPFFPRSHSFVASFFSSSLTPITSFTNTLPRNSLTQPELWQWHLQPHPHTSPQILTAPASFPQTPPPSYPTTPPRTPTTTTTIITATTATTLITAV